MRVAVGTRAAFRGDRVPSEMVFPAASGEAAEPPLLELSRMATYVKYPYLEFHRYRELVRQL
jgi:hypothetical protein